LFLKVLLGKDLGAQNTEVVLRKKIAAKGGAARGI